MSTIADLRDRFYMSLYDRCRMAIPREPYRLGAGGVTIGIDPGVPGSERSAVVLCTVADGKLQVGDVVISGRNGRAAGHVGIVAGPLMPTPLARLMDAARPLSDGARAAYFASVEGLLGHYRRQARKRDHSPGTCDDLRRKREVAANSWYYVNPERIVRSASVCDRCTPRRKRRIERKRRNALKARRGWR